MKRHEDLLRRIFIDDVASRQVLYNSSFIVLVAQFSWITSSRSHVLPHILSKYQGCTDKVMNVHSISLEF